MSVEPELRQIDEREALKRGVEVSVRRLRSLGVSRITDEQVETAYKAGVAEIDRYFGELGNRNGTILSGRGFGNSSMAHSMARDMNIAGERARNELRLELVGFQNQHNADAETHPPKKSKPRGRPPKAKDDRLDKVAKKIIHLWQNDGWTDWYELLQQYESELPKDCTTEMLRQRVKKHRNRQHKAVNK